uniref:BTB domain-containing protein n=1 Tax=Mycena chlorophos TaxID=658473 RepID=A0ABQ0LWU6_MYCCL|nr:predicted protein [Mycena chlorophos]
MEVQRSSEYWFDDGNIVLQAEQTQFRVTKSMLAMHSTVFRDMLTIPLPPDEPVVDGCPIVFLPDDKPEDWKHLLDAMYPKSWAQSQNPTLDVIHSILRLSRKYDVPAFRQECIRRLKLEFPSTFEGLEAVWGAWKHIEMDPGRGDINTVFQLINLSREFGLPSLLPLACYIVAASSSKEAMQRVSDGTSVPPLSVADQLICWKGHVELIKRGAMSKMAWLEAIGAEDSDCQHPKTSSNRISMCFECHTFLDNHGLILPAIDLSPLITAVQSESATVGTRIPIPTPQPFYVRFVPRNPADADTLLVNDTMCSKQLDGTWIIDVDTWEAAQTKTAVSEDGLETVELVTKARKIPRPDDRFLWKLPAAVELQYVLCLAFSRFFSFSNWLGNPDAPPALRKTVEQLYTLFVLGQARRLAVGGIENLDIGRDSSWGANQGGGGSGGGSAGATFAGPASQWHAVDEWRRRVHHALHEQTASLPSESPTLEAHNSFAGMVDLEKVMVIAGYDEVVP